MQIIRFSSSGEEDPRVGDDQCLAKLIDVSDKNKIFYVRSTKDGRLYKPSENIKKKRDGIFIYSLRSVKQECFETYINFLRTGRESILLNAERKI